MQATITIQSLIEMYTKYMARELTYTNSARPFSSEFLCHQISEALTPKGGEIHSYSGSRPMTYGDINNYEIGQQFRDQWIERVLRIDESKRWQVRGGVLEQWNDETSFDQDQVGIPKQNRGTDWCKVYRLACLQKAAAENPELTFTFSDYL